MKVAFIVPGWRRVPGRRPTPTGVTYYRCTLPAEGLNRFAPGVHAEVFEGVTFVESTGELRPIVTTDRQEQPTRRDDTGWDVIVLKGWMDERLADSIRRARAFGQIVVNDIDDHYWALPANNPARGDLDAGWNPDHYRSVVAASSHITVSTPYLAELFADLGPPITVLPNVLDLDAWNRQPVGELRTIGWCGHLGWRSRDLETLGSAVRYFLRDHPSVRFVHGGHDPAVTHIAQVLNIPKSRVEVRPIRPVEKWPKIWDGIDLAICPLAETDFNRAKSDLKRLEAAAAGVPAVCTRLDPYLDWEDCTALATTPTEWRDALERYVSKEERTAASAGGDEHVRTRGIADRWRDWHDLYARLCAAGEP